MANPRILERLRKSRTELSQKELAQKLGMSLSTYRRMIDGAAPFTIDAAREASKFFKVPLEELLESAAPESEKVTSGDSMMIIVTLDGSQKLLDSWIRRLTQINQTF